MLQHFRPNKTMTASSYESVQKGLEGREQGVPHTPSHLHRSKHQLWEAAPTQDLSLD